MYHRGNETEDIRNAGEDDLSQISCDDEMLFFLSMKGILWCLCGGNLQITQFSENIDLYKTVCEKWRWCGKNSITADIGV